MPNPHFLIYKLKYYDAESKRISFQDATGFHAFDFEIRTLVWDQNDYDGDSTLHLDSVAILYQFSLSANELGTGTSGLTSSR